MTSRGPRQQVYTTYLNQADGGGFDVAYPYEDPAFQLSSPLSNGPPLRRFPSTHARQQQQQAPPPPPPAPGAPLAPAARSKWAPHAPAARQHYASRPLPPHQAPAASQPAPVPPPHHYQAYPQHPPAGPAPNGHHSTPFGPSTTRRTNSMQRRRSFTLSRTPSGTYRRYEQPSSAAQQQQQIQWQTPPQQQYYSQVYEPSSSSSVPTATLDASPVPPAAPSHPMVQLAPVAPAPKPSISNSTANASNYVASAAQPPPPVPPLKGFDKWSTSWTRRTMQDPVRAAARQRQPRPPLLLAATTNLSKTFERRDPNYSYHPDNNPKRILTQPSKPAKNDGYDNENSDYILFVNDILGEGIASYRVIDLLGQGTYGQVVKCEHLASKELYSVKVIKNRANFRRESHMEANILKKLNEHAHSDRHILRLETTFTHKNHFCLVFELLSVNLFELIRQTGFKGLPLSLVRNISRQLLDALDFLFEARVIHCDLKPENILLQNVASPKIKVIDFGSACYKTNPKYTYIQSRFYRSPEVILKLFYSHGIDMWSLGCITAELFTGVPLFPGSSEFDQLSRIMDMLGEPPTDVLDYGKDTSYYFDTETQHGRTIYKRKSREKYNKDNNKRERAHTNHHKHSNLKDIIMSHGRANNEPLPAFDMQMREQLVDFLLQCLDLHSLKRWQPATALKHPFITGSLATDAQGASSMRQQRSQSLYQPNTNTRLPAAIAAEPRRRATLNYPAKPLG